MMFPGAVATATEYDIPAVWVISQLHDRRDWDLQRFYMDGREIGTSFVKHSTGEFWNPDFAKMAEAMGAGGITVRALATSARASGDGACIAGDRREGQPRHGRAVDRDLALRADPAGRADVRKAARPPREALPVRSHRRPGEAGRRSWSMRSIRPSAACSSRGRSVTGKSTAVRGLAELLPEIEVVADCPFACHPAQPCPRRERVARGELASCAAGARRPALERDRGPGGRLSRHRPRAA